MKNLIRFQLSAMMFLEYFIWGAWFVTMSTYLTEIGFQGTEIGSAYSTTAWAAIISSFFISLIADKYFAAQKLTGVLHIIGGVLLYYTSTITDPGPFFWVLLGYAICYMPTVALTNTIALKQTQDAGKDFPKIRVLGTIGWIVAGIFISYLGIENGPQPMRIAAGLSIVMGVFSFFLPNTPPEGTDKKVTVSDVLGLDALKLMKSRSFATLILGSLFITIPFAMYHGSMNLFLNEIGVENAAFKMTFGQMSEIIFLLVMPFFFARLGVKKMLLAGMFAWVTRYLLFAFGAGDTVVWMLYAGIILHGISYDFFFVTGQIYVDKQAPKELRASVQGFMTFITYGVGMLLGSLVTGIALQEYQITDGSGKVIGHYWMDFMLIPAAIAGVVTLFFMIAFKSEKQDPVVEQEDIPAQEEVPAPL